MSFELEHPLMGRVCGNKVNGAVQFLGVKYGSLSGRMAASQMMSYGAEGVVDATKYGPPPLFPPSSVDIETGFIQQSLRNPDIPPVSELEGLNLNITVPTSNGSKLATGSPLPVLVYIHGGGLAFGSSWYPHYDQARIVKLSTEIGHPMIAININYRLGIPGFLTSAELRKRGFPANNGLRDQETALKWIKKYISGFGGDPDAITVAGQSAGAVCVNLLLHRSEPLFSQAILLAGTAVLMKAAKPETAEFVYDAFMKEFGLDQLSSEDRVKAFLELGSEEIVNKVTPASGLGPVIDDDMIHASTSFAALSELSDLLFLGKSWCRRILTNDCSFDASIIALTVLISREAGIRQAFKQSITSFFSDADPAVVEKLLRAYNLTSDISDNQAMMRITQLLNDVNFYAPSIILAAGWPHACVTHFNEGNPWDGPMKGRASHMLDIAYLWQNYNGTLSNPPQAVAKRFAEDIINFVTATDTLPNFRDDKLVTVYGPSSEGRVVEVVRMDHEQTGRRFELFDIAAELGGFDKILEATTNFMIGK